jgi:methyltransferase family protein
MMERVRAWAVHARETLDDPAADAGTVVASLRDIARINRTFGGTAAATRRLEAFLVGERPGATFTLLDVGTGCGDMPRALADRASRRGITLRLLGVERHPAAAREAARTGAREILADGAWLPLPDHSVDFVLCAKLLHHLPGAAGIRLLRELDRVARRAVVVAEIRRSWLAAAGLWLVSYPMRFHPATRRDGVISVFRGFAGDELLAACRAAGVDAAVRSHPGWCLTAAWRPAAAHA